MLKLYLKYNLSKVKILPFVKKKFYLKEEQRPIFYLINELGYSQKEAQRLIAKGRILVNNEPLTKVSQAIKGEFEFIYFKPKTLGLKPTYEADEFVVFDKPSGVLIHPQNRFTEYSLIDELKFQFGKDANIAHRIDKETSGLVLCAKNKESEKKLKMMFQQRDMQKKYLALVHGIVKNDFEVDEPLLVLKDKTSAIIRTIVKVDKDGKSSQTSFKVLQHFKDKNMTLLECSPHTGRQHQIRVHLFHVKHPIVGDPIYGQNEELIIKYLDKILPDNDRIKHSGATRLLLHANELEFKLDGKKYNIKSNINFIDLINLIT